MSPCSLAVGRPSAFRALAVVVLPTSRPALRLVRVATAGTKGNFIAYDLYTGTALSISPHITAHCLPSV